MKLKIYFNKRVLFLTVIASITIALLSGCGNTPASTSSSLAPQSAEAPTGGKLKVGVAKDFSTMDPAKSTSLTDEELYNNIYDPMVKLTPDGKFIPGLATKWTISEDGKTYTFELRKGVKFHDGTDFNAEAVMYNWSWIRDKANASARYSDLILIEDISAPDPFTVVVKLKTPFSPFIGTITGRSGLISSPAAKKKFGNQYEMNPVGTGPFQFVEWNRNDHLTIRKNPNYWEQGQPKLDEVEFKPIVNQSQKLNALISGQLDLVDSIPFQDIPKVEKTKGLKFGIMTSFGNSGIRMNLVKGPLNNMNNRRAINFAMNRDEINQVIYFGKFVPGYTFFSPTNFAYDPSLKTPFSLELAKEELKKAGNPEGFTFTYLSANDPVSLQVAQLYQSQLAKAGITMKIESLDSAVVNQRRNSGDWEASAGGWSGMIDPDQNSYAFMATNGSSNYGKYSNPQVDKLLQAAREAQSIDERKKFYSQFSAILLEEVPQVFTGYQPVIDVWTDKVKGFEVYPDQLLRLAKVTISK
jgi:peptide/nickel transport system substrate-binding protein